MNDVNANIIVDLDTSNALQSLKALQTQISDFNRSIVQGNAQAMAAQKSMVATLTAQISATKQFSTSMVNVESSVSRLGRSIDKNKLSLGEYFRYGAASSKTFGSVFKKEHNEILALATERVKKLQTQYIALGEAQNGVTKAMAVRPMQLFNAETAIGIQRQQLFNKLLHDGSTSILNWGKNTQWAGRQLMVGFTVPLTIFGGVAGQIFMDLERQVVNFRRVYGDAMTPAGETDLMVSEIQKLGKEFTKYGIAVKDTVGLAGQVAAAGAQGDDLVAATAQSTRLATLGMIEMNQAMTATMALQTAFQLSNEKLAQSIDFLNAVENQTVLSLDDVSQAIPLVAPVIKGLGGDVQDLAIFLTAMREGGVNAAEGANALKSGLASLINPTKNAREQLNKVGININYILSKNKGDIRAIVTEFGAALGELGKFERQQTLAKVFGKYQFARLGALFENISREGSQAQRVVDLTGQSFEELNALAEKELTAIEESIGMKFTGAVERLKLAIAPIGEVFLKIATPIIDVVTKLLDKFNELSPGVKQFITVLVAGVGVVVPTVIMLIGLFGNFIGQAIKGFALFNNFFNRLRGGGSDLEYLANEELDAAAAAATLEGKTTSLTSALNIQRSAVGQLARAYENYATSAKIAAVNLPQGFRGKPLRGMATGGFVAGSGNKDSEPALLMPGEFVVNKKAAEKYGPILSAMNEGKIKELAEGSPTKNVPMFGETALRLQSGKENMSQKASNIIVDEVLTLLSLRVGEARGMIPSQAKVSAGAFDPIAKELRPIAQDFVDKVNFHFNETFKDIENTSDRMKESWRKAGQDLSASVEKMPDVDKTVVKRYMGIEEDLYGTIPTMTRREGDTQLTRARKSAFTRGAGLPRSYTAIGGAARGLFERLTGRSAKGMQIGHVFDSKQVDLSELAQDPNASSAVKTAMKNLAQVGSKEMSETIAKDQPIGKGLASEIGRNSPHRQAVQNGEDDGKGYVKSFTQTVERGMSRRRATRPQGPAGMSTADLEELERARRQSQRGRRVATRAGGISPLAIRPGEQTSRVANIGDAQTMAMQEEINRAHAEALKENTARTNDFTKEIAKQPSRLKTFGNSLLKGSGKMQGAFFALDGLVFGLSFMENSVGDFAQKLMPAVFGVQALTSMLPMLMNPVGIAIAAMAAAGAALWKVNDNMNELRDSAKKMNSAMLNSSKSVEDAAAFYGNKTIGRKNQLKEFGTTQEQLSKAEEYLQTETGKRMVEGFSIAMEKMGTDSATTQFATKLSSMMMQGAITDQQARDMAHALETELGIIGLSSVIEGKLTKIVGEDGKDIRKNPIKVAVELQANNEQFATMMTNNISSLMGTVGKDALGLAGASTGGLISPIGGLTALTALGDTQGVSGVGRNIRSFFDPNFAALTAAAYGYGDAVSAIASEGYNTLNAAQERYTQLKKKADAEDDPEKKKKLIASLKEQKEALKMLEDSTKSFQETNLKTFSSQALGIQDEMLLGLEESLKTSFEGTPEAATLQALLAKTGDMDKTFRFNIETLIASGQMSPSVMSAFISEFTSSKDAQMTIDMMLKGDNPTDVQKKMIDILNIKDEELRKRAIIVMETETKIKSGEDTSGGLDVFAGTALSEQERGSNLKTQQALRQKAADAQAELDRFEGSKSYAATAGSEEGNVVGLKQDQLNNQKQALADLRASYENAGMGIGLAGKELEDYVNQQEIYQNQVENVTNAQKELDDAIKAASEAGKADEEFLKERNALQQKAKAAQDAYNDSVAASAPLSRIERAELEKTYGTLEQRTRAYTDLSVAQDALQTKGDQDIVFDPSGKTLEQINKTIAAMDYLNKEIPEEILKTIDVDSLLANSNLDVFNIKWRNIKNQKDLLKIIEVDKTDFDDALSQAGLDWQEFNALPDINKTMTMAYITGYITYQEEAKSAADAAAKASQAGDVAGMKSNLKRADVASVNAYMAQQNAKAAAAEDYSPKGDETDSGDKPPAPKDTSGGGGGGKTDPVEELKKSIMEKMNLYLDMNKYVERLKKFKGNVAKALKGVVYEGSLASQLRQQGISEMMIADILSKGPDAAKKFLDQGRKNMQNLNRKMLAGARGEIVSGYVGKKRISQSGLAALDKLKGTGLTTDEINRIASDETESQVVASLKVGSKAWKEYVNGVKSASAASEEFAEKQDPVQYQINQLQSIFGPISSYMGAAFSDAFRKIDINHRQSIKNYEDSIEAKQKDIETIEDEIDALQRLNDADSRVIRDKERQSEIIGRQISELERQNEIDGRRINNLKREDEIRNRISDALNHELELMSRMEESIKETYQARLDALTEVTKLNDYIINQQKNQLDLSRSLSEGDVYAAAQSRQQMQSEQARYASDQVRSGLEQGMQNAIDSLTTSQGFTRQEAENQINIIKDQSYQTSLKIRDIEDDIYNRNQAIIPLKDQQFNLDKEILVLKDAIYARETDIQTIQVQRLQPRQDELDALQKSLKAEQDRVQEEKDSVKIANLTYQQWNDIEGKVNDSLKQYSALNDIMKSNLLPGVKKYASAWVRLGETIAAANKAAKEQQTYFDFDPNISTDIADAVIPEVVGNQSTVQDLIQKLGIDVTEALGAGRAIAGGMGIAFSSGGIVPKYFANGGKAMGTDTIPSMLTPGEFVVKKSMVDKYGTAMFEKINRGTFDMPRYSVDAEGVANVRPTNVSNVTAPVYNSYSINVPVNQPNASADEIAYKVMTKIKNIESASIRRVNGY